METTGAAHRTRTLCGLSLAALALLVAPAPPARAEDKPASARDTCFECHRSALNDAASQGFRDDIHRARGLSCAACHGGDPAAEDMPDAMDPAKGFIGVPRRAQVPQLCARCHADGAFMRTYNPSLRTDQLAQYLTSVHGQRLRGGDTRVAVCTDCHSVHGIRPASSPASSVHPLNLPDTCGRCHSDAARMQTYKIPTDQAADYRASVHFQTLERGDLAAPSCATCHGNHGAAPPGVASVERVCGTCHVFQEQLFDQSPHKAPWDALGFPSCLTCHGNHRIEPTGDHLIGTGEKSFCATCHSEGEPGWEAAGRIHTSLTGLDSVLRRTDGILDRAERAGMDVAEARVVQASAQEQLIKARVDVHTVTPARIDEVVTAGQKLAAQAYQAGEEALAELAFRRKGLALSLIIIALVVLGLWLLIRELEARKPPA
ncbi:MAG: cytochrome c3 family protein [Candidatus Acidiferrales bacterium]